MKKHVIGMVGVGAAFGIWMSACDIDQPLPACPVPHPAFFSPGTLVRYELVEGDANQSCGQLTYEFVGLAKYEDKGTDNPIRLAIRPASLGGLTPTFSGEPFDADDQASAIGIIDKMPNDEGICTASDFSVAQVTRGAADPLGPLNLQYQFSNFRIVSTAAIPGTQFQADLSYTDDNCTAQYKVVGIHPAVPCGSEGIDEETFLPIGQPDDSMCQATEDEAGDPVLACNTALGTFPPECINPDFALKCDPVSLFCIQASDALPALKAAE